VAYCAALLLKSGRLPAGLEGRLGVGSGVSVRASLKGGLMTKGKIQNPGRRQVIRVAGAAGFAAIVLPQSWTKPILRAVVVPAHAQTTPATQSATTTAKPASTTKKPDQTTNPPRTTPRTTNPPSTTSTTTQRPSTTGARFYPSDASAPDSKLAVVIDSLGLMKS
jgi:hypothetical protein